ncbi:hypothetical protein C8D90_104222 [Enterobacillus tribolii]|uniref:Uncharacterized protein n=1 Tax=Enterobacillus tribolii TaxID=1487935 RepID=A0A370QS54_9GAMM|nr:hypothetical protein C8D90_104222 [Enterobacillus tribolii]
MKGDLWEEGGVPYAKAPGLYEVPLRRTGRGWLGGHPLHSRASGAGHLSRPLRGCLPLPSGLMAPAAEGHPAHPRLSPLPCGECRPEGFVSGSGGRGLWGEVFLWEGFRTRRLRGYMRFLCGVRAEGGWAATLCTPAPWVRAAFPARFAGAFLSLRASWHRLRKGILPILASRRIPAASAGPKGSSAVQEAGGF